jgi:hypothetical protein
MIFPPRDAGAKRLRQLALTAVIALTASVQAAEMRILQFERVTTSSSVQPQARGSTPGLRLRLAGPTRQHEFLLEPNTELLPGGQVGDTLAFRGTLPGLAGSWARLTRRGGRYQGIYSDGAQIYLLDDAAGAAGASTTVANLDPDETISYRLADLQISGILFEGDIATITRTGSELVAQIGAALAPPMAAAVLATRRLDVAIVADTELVALDGANTQANAIARLNIVDGIFGSQVGVQLRVAGVTNADSQAESLTSTVPGTLLDQLKAYRGRSAVQQASGLTHLMTGRDLDAQTVGIAFIGSICSRSFGASLSEARNSVGFDALIAAHEIGHTFGAPHDGDATAACGSTSDITYLMAPRLNGSSTFSDCSLQEIAKVVATASCLAQIDAPDVTVAVPTSSALALNQATTVLFSVRSVGNATVNGVTLSVTPPTGVTVGGGGATGGSCDTLGGRLNCTLGSLAANENRDVQLVLTGTLAGTSAATVQVAASNDGLAQNNRSQLVLVTAPGADLSLAVSADATSLAVGANTLLHLTLRNLGLANAPDAKLTLTLPAGLTVRTATATGLSCTLPANGALDCPAGSLDAGATASLLLDVQATASGALPVAASLRSASLADPQPGNNNAAVTLTGVQPAAPAGGGGGGGSLGPVALALLGLWVLSRFRRVSPRHWSARSD